MRAAAKGRLPALIVFLFVSAAYLCGLFSPLDRFVTDTLFEVLRRDASGTAVVVEIDSKSLRALDVWPWPRSYHAEVLDRLFDAGAKTVAIDVDFSSRTLPAEDRALADAIERARGRVVLPVFHQRIQHGAERIVASLTEPMAALARHADLASVNVYMDDDGRVRRYGAAQLGPEGGVPSFSARLAGRAGTSLPPFYLDFGIRLETIPHLSFVDVMRGGFDPGQVRDKVVVIGATAVELGDRIPVPAYGVMTGPLLQALAYESIVQGRTIQPVAPWAILAAGLAFAAFATSWFRSASWRSGAIAAIASVPVFLILGAAVQWIAPVTVDLSVLWAATLLCYLTHVLAEVDRKTLQLFIHRILAHHHRAMLTSVVYDSFDGIVIVDESGRIKLLNPMAERMLGVPSERSVGQPLTAIVPEFAEVLGHRAESGGNASVQPIIRMDLVHEVPVRHSDGPVLTAELVISHSTLKPGRYSFMGNDLDQSVFILTFRDISERKRAEEAERAAAQQAIAASRAKSEFLANISHELRTPLNAIIGFSEILNAEMLGPIGVPEYREYVSDIHLSGLHLLEVINEILDMSKIEAGEMKLDESLVDVAAIIGSCARLIEQRAKAAKLSISLALPEDLPPVRADQRLVKQILLNLLSNAVKFTGAGGSITVESRITADDELVVSVTDTGIGIAEGDLVKVLTPFGQVDSGLERKYEGTGLGLPLVKSMMELHGGRIEIRSKLGIGTTVAIFFGPERIAPNADIARPAAAPDTAGELAPV